MNPYYQDSYATLYHGDSCELLPQLQGDVVLTDPPYGVGVDYDAFNDSPEELVKLVGKVFPLIKAVAPRIALTPGIANIWRYPPADWVLAWIVPAGAGSSIWGFTTWQPVLVYGQDPYLKHGMGRRPDSITQTESAQTNGHPCPKPIDVWQRILLRVSVLPTDVIIDPFAGSGTTLVAAKNLGRKAIGIELSERYCEIAAERMSQGAFDFGGV